VDGQWHDVLSRGVPVRDARGEIRCWAGINLDISRLKQAEEDLRRLNVRLDQRVVERTAELAQAVEALNQQRVQLRALAADLTLTEQRERDRLAEFLHSDLQQLLVATRLRVVALERVPDPGVQADAREILALTEEAITATRTLTRELSPPSLQRGGLLPALEWLATWVLEKHKLTVHLSTLPGPPPSTPPALAVLLYQAVRELLLNAVKHAHVSDVEVTFASESAGLTVTVADAGAGFDPALLRTAGGREGGFGLLGIHERLEWVGGRLSIVSAPGQGSRFTVWAPLPAASENASPPARPIRIAVVDDHTLVRQGIITLLAAEPDLHVVGEATNGQQAIDLVRSLVPDVVLMDVSMPVMGGIAATRAIRDACPAVRVIGLSAAEDPAQEEAMRQAGAAAYLRKSQLAEALLTAIRRVAAAPQASRDPAAG
jgi:signal transduction histidine kinase/CheY-like chemotaxis protein